MTYTLGVDIGTSYTAAAVWRDGRASTVTLADRADSIPSAVFLREDGGLLIGDAAVRRGVLEPDRLARGFKRQLADPVPLLLGTESVTRPHLTGQLLRFVLQKVIAREGGPPAHVTLTVPAQWGDHHRQLMTQVAAEAGLTDVGLLPEPVAVAIHYAAQERLDLGASVAVYDLGGGTFDTAIVQRTPDGYELRGQPGGDESIGGEDFDDVVMNHVRRNLGNALAMLDMSDDAVLAGLQQVRTNAVDAKEALSADVDASIAVILPGLTKQIRYTRAEFEAAIRIPLLRTVDALERTMASAGVSPAQLHAVLLAGGSAQIPLVSQLLAAELGVQIVTDAHPKYATCLGAALSSASRAQAAARVAAPPPISPESLIAFEAAAPAASAGALLVQPEVVLRAAPSDIGLTAPADVTVRAAPGVRTKLRYLSARDEFVIEHHRDTRRAGRALLIAVVVVGALVAGVVLGATQGWFKSNETPPPAVTSSATTTQASSTVKTGPALTPTPTTMPTATGESAVAVATSGAGLIAVGALEDPVAQRIWRSDGTTWTAAALPRLPAGQVGQLTDVEVDPDKATIATGWLAPSADAADPKKRVGAIWVLGPVGDWTQAIAPSDIGPLTALVKLPSGWLAAGETFVDDPQGDAFVLASASGTDWKRVTATGLDGPDSLLISGMVPGPDGGVIALGSQLESAVNRSGLFFSADGSDWNLESWLPSTEGSAYADGIGLDAAGRPVVVGAQGGFNITPTLWLTENGELVPHPVEVGNGKLLDVATTPQALVIVGTLDGEAASWQLPL